MAGRKDHTYIIGKKPGVTYLVTFTNLERKRKIDPCEKKERKRKTFGTFEYLNLNQKSK